MKNAYSKIVIIAFVFLFASCKESVEFSVTDGLLISNATIISANEKEEIQSYVRHILIESDSILFCGKELPQIHGTFELIDATDKYIIPGLIDSHVHVGHAIGLRDEHYETRQDLVKSYFEQLPRSYLYFGFTTLVDLDLNERNRVCFDQAPIKPTLYSTSRGIRYFDGYGQSFFPKNIRYRIFPKWIFDTSQQPNLPSEVDPKAHLITSVIQETIDAGRIAVKTYYEAGFGGTFNWPVPSDSLLEELVSEAHERGLPVILHSTSLEAYKKGIGANVDIFGHGLWHWDGDPLASTPPKELKDMYQRMAETGKYLQPTMRVTLGEYDTFTWSLIDSQDLKHSLSSEYISWMSSDEGRWPQQELIELYNANKSDSSISNERYFKNFNKRVKKTTKMAFDQGVKIILGSDTPASEGIGNVPGLNGFLEIMALSDAGVDNETVFLAATFRNAKAFGIADQVGSIQVGKKADLLLLKSNPLDDISSYNQIEMVILSGNPINREMLSATHDDN